MKFLKAFWQWVVGVLYAAWRLLGPRPRPAQYDTVPVLPEATHTVVWRKTITGKWNLTVRHRNGQAVVWSTQGYNRTGDGLTALGNFCQAWTRGTVNHEGLPRL